VRKLTLRPPSRIDSRRQLGRLALRLLFSRRCPARLSNRLARVATGNGALRELGGTAIGPAMLVALSRDELGRQLLNPSLPAPSLAASWTFLEQAELRPVVIRRLGNEVPEEWSEGLYQVTVLDIAESASRAASALAVAAGLAGRLIPQHEREIFTRCVALLGRNPDPYDPLSGQLMGAAREAAAALLEVDVGLDDLAADVLSQGQAPLMRAAVASALRTSDDGGTRFLTYVKEIKPASEELVRLAEDCDSAKSSADPVFVEKYAAPSRAAGVRGRLVAPARALGVLLLGPLLGACLVLVGSHVHGRLTTIKVEATVAIGALAVLAAVHVLSVQLAIGNLPRSVARSVLAPPLIMVAYGLGLTLLAVTLLAGIEPPPSWHAGAAAGVLLVLFVVVVAVAIIDTLRNVSVADASATAARRARPRAMHTGDKVAGFSDQEQALKTVIDRRDYLRMQMSTDEGSRRHPLWAGQTGILEIDASKLDSLHTRSVWREGDLRLDLMNIPGAQVVSRHEYACIVPARRAKLTGDDLELVTDAFRVRSHRHLKQMAELCTTMVDQMVAVGQAGDLGGAFHIQDELVILLRLHLWTARGRTGLNVNPPSRVLIDVVNRTLAALARVTSEDLRELCVSLVRELLATAGESDPVIGLIIAHTITDDTPSLSQLSVLYLAGQRALNQASPGDTEQVQRALHKLIDGDSMGARYANETAARLVQYAAMADPLNSRRAWSRYKDASQSAPTMDQIFSFARIGAAAQRVGNLSLAVEVAFSFPPGTDLEALRTVVHQAERAEHENLLSRLFGRLLGEDAETKIDRFIDAAKIYRASLPMDSNASESGS
jgi:hypothetical protein